MPSFSPATSAPASEDKPRVGASPQATAPMGVGQVPVWRSVVLLALTALVSLTYWYNPPIDVQPVSGVVMKLPVIVGDYFGKAGAISEAESKILPADTELVRRMYTDTKGHQLEATIVLSGAEQRSIHRPEGCLVGQGWTIIGQEDVPIALQSGHSLTTRKLTLERYEKDENDQRIVVRAMYVYWFVGENITTASEIHRVMLSNWDRVIHNRAHRWAYVSFFSLITENLARDGLDAGQTEQMLTDFARQVVPTFQIDEMPPEAQE